MDVIRPFKIMLLRQAAAALEWWIQTHGVPADRMVALMAADPPLLWQAIQEIPADDAQWQRVQQDPKVHWILRALTHDDYDVILDELARDGGPCVDHAVALAQPAVRPRFNAQCDAFRDWLLHPASHPLPPPHPVSSP